MTSAISALSLNAQRLGASADNIANVSTKGYKTTRVEGSTLVTQQTSQTAYSAGGVLSAPRHLADVQGLLTSDSRSTSMAISGDGYFAVSRAGQGGTFYTRDGSFDADASGNLVNASGDVLLGRGADGSGPLRPVNVSTIGGTASATTSVSVGANLPANAASGDSYTINVQATDSLGAARNLELTFTQGAAPGAYTLSIAGATEGSATGPAYSETVTFGANGQFAGAGPANIHVPGTGGAADMNIALDVTSMTRYAGGFVPGHIQADGASYGQVSGIGVAADGTVSATFNNGQVRTIATVPVATFTNPGGLEPVGGGAYRATDASGAVTYRAGGEGGAGTVQGGALELSTTDLGTEFANMIVAEHAYRASLQTLSAAQDMSRALLDLKG